MKTITTEERLLTPAWTQDTQAVVQAIKGFAARRPLNTACRVVLFELAGDRELHVNVTHEYATASAFGWSGPGVTREGFVHNRRFAARQRSQIVRAIRDMVFSPRLSAVRRSAGVSA